MRGNIFICLNEQTYNSEIPDILSRCRRVEFSKDGSSSKILPTTFAQMGEDNTTDFGKVQSLSVDGVNFYILQFNASWLNGEVSYLKDLGKGLSYPNNALLLNAEARKLLEENISKEYEG